MGKENGETSPSGTVRVSIIFKKARSERLEEKLQAVLSDEERRSIVPYKVITGFKANLNKETYERLRTTYMNSEDVAIEDITTKRYHTRNH